MPSFERRTILTALTAGGLTAGGLTAGGLAGATTSGGRPAHATPSDRNRPPRTGLGAYGVDGHVEPFDHDIKNNTMAISVDERRAVVANSETGRVRIIDLRGVVPSREIRGYVTPRNILFVPDGRSFLISDSSRGVVDQVSADGRRLLARIPLGAGAFGTALTRDGTRLYVNNQASNTVTVVELQRRRPVTVIGGFSQPRQGIKLSPKDDVLYVTNFKADRITTVDPTTNEITGQIEGFAQIRGLSISRDGSRLYGANSGDNTIAIADTATGKIIRRVPVGEKPYGAALAPDEAVLLSGDLGSHTVTVVDPAAGTVKGVIKGTIGPRQAISYARTSVKAWVLNEDLTVAEIDVPRMRVTRTLG